MSATSIWRGTKQLTQGKVKWSFTTEKITVTTDFQGPYFTCVQAAKAMTGMQIAGLSDYGLLVSSALVNELDGNAGRIDVTLEATQAASNDVSNAAVGEPVYEVEFGSLTKALETHPKCGTLKDDRPKYRDGVRDDDRGKQRTWEDWQALDGDDYEPKGGGGWDLATYRDKKQKGVDSYTVSAPVVRRTLYYLRNPGGVGISCNKKQFPPADIDWPDNYVYINSTDSITREGKKRVRRTEWLGAESVDTDLYPEG